MIDAKLYTLLAVAEKKNFTRAAEELNLTQPAISHHINQLEKEVGAKLFVRKKADLLLTPEGEIALKYARRMKAMNEKMKSDIAESGKHLTRIRIGVTHTAESNMVTEALAMYGSNNPGVTIVIIADTINNLYDMLENYELDLAIVEEKPHNPELSSLMLDTDYLVCVVSNNNQLAGKPMVTLQELKKEKLILRLPKSETVGRFVSSLTSSGVSIGEFNIILEVDNIATIKDLIRKDFGISILAKSACEDELKKGKLTALPIENMSMIRETNIVYHKDFSYIDVVRELVLQYRKANDRV